MYLRVVIYAAQIIVRPMVRTMHETRNAEAINRA